MATTNFIPGTVVTKEWLNDVDAFVYEGVTPGTTSLNIDTITEKTTDAGVTVEGVLLKDTTIDINGTADALILDTDGDTTISAPTDDQIDIEISGADDFRFTANKLTALSGSVIETDTINETTATSGVTIDSVQLKDGTAVMTSAFSFRNKLINGNFEFWQRGTSLTAGGTPRYLADRWTTDSSVTTVTPSRQSFTLGQTDVPGEPRYFHRAIIASSAGAGNFAMMTQKVESVRSLANKTATVSFYAKADASKNIAVEFVQNFGTGGSPSASIISIGVTTVALTTSWQKFTITTTIPSISGSTLGSNNDDFLHLIFWFDAGSNFNARTNTLGQQSGTFDIAQVQLEEGSVATPFEQRPFGLEFSLCQRYYEKSFALATVPAQNAGTTNSTRWRANAAGASQVGSGSIFYKVPKRTTPNITIYNPSAANAQARNAGSSADCSSTSVLTGSDGIGDFQISCTGDAGCIVGHTILIHWSSDAEL